MNFNLSPKEYNVTFVNGNNSAISFTQPTTPQATFSSDTTLQTVVGNITVIDAGGAGSLEYNSETRVLTYTGPDIQDQLVYTAGNGITITDTEISVDTNVIATKSYADTAVSQAIDGIIDGAPEVLDTLKEIADALGNDPDFVGTIAGEIASKLDIDDFVSAADSWLGSRDTDALQEGNTNLYYTDARVADYISTQDTDILAEGSSNLYYTEDRVDANFATKSTTDLQEGNNLYFTIQRADTAFDDRLITKSTTDLAEGTNLYYTTTRANTDFDARLATKSTTDLVEGNNQYFTTARADTAFDARLAIKTTDNLTEGLTNLYYTQARANSDFDSRLQTKSTTDITEGTNLYYTEARVDANFNSKTTDNLSEGSNNLYYTTGRQNTDFDARLATKDTTDLAEGDNLYYTQGRFDSAFSNKSTTNLQEGTNLYYTDGRFDTRLATKSTTDLAEGTNQYFTQARARDSISAGNGITYNSTNGSVAVDTNVIATKSYTDNAVSVAITNIIDGAPAALDTLNELAQALGNDANFATTITNEIGNKLNTADFTTTANTWLGTKSTTDLTEGTNLYYTDGRFDSRLATKSTTDIAEGNNLYFTIQRADSAFDDRLATKSTTDLTEGTNLYYTQGRFDTAFSNKSTTDLQEGNNLYFTTARADTAFDARLATKSTTDITEGTNLYYTDGRFDGRLATKSTTDIAEGTNLYYTDGRVNANFATKSTTDLTEGNNLYYTTARANTDFDSRLATKSTTDIAEGNNLYFTTARADTAFDNRLATKSTTNLAEGLNLYYTEGRVNANFATKSTTDLAEGTNLYFTTARARQSISGNNGITYNSTTGSVAVDTEVIATIQYVNEVAEGLAVKPAAEIATTGNLDAVYDNGTLGVGATLTGSTNGAFPTIDGVTLTSTNGGQNGVLVKNQTNAAHNGRYNLTQVGDANTPWILTRCALCDEASEIPGSYTFVKRGTTQAGTGWVQIVADPETFTVGTDPIMVVQFSKAEDLQAGTGIDITGNVISSTITQYTDEQAQDAVAAMLTEGDNISLVYDDNANTLTVSVVSPVDEAYTVVEECVNKSGGFLPKGTPVYATSVGQAQGMTLQVAAADAGDPNKMPVVGVLSDDLDDDDEGTMIVIGPIRNINTTAFNRGDTIYVGVGGGYTNTPPSGEANIIQVLGTVTRSAENGGGIVNVTHPTDTPNLNNGRIFIGNSSNEAAIATLDTSIVPENTNLYYTDTRFDNRLATKSTSDITEGTNLYYTTTRANTDFDTRLATKSTTDIAEGTNLYFTTSRADTAFDNRLATKSTTDLAEGTNLYYTDTRFDNRLQTKSTTDIAEGTNLYFTQQRARDSFSAGTNITISNGVISATVPAGYTDADARNAISVNDVGGDGSLTYNSTTGVFTYTGPSAAEVRAHFSAGTGITLTNGEIAVDNTIATKAYADNAATVAVAAVIDGAPEALDTLNELAAALGNDANFATTITNEIGNKLNTADFTTTANTWLGTKSTTDLAEGTNLYYTTSRANTDFDNRLAIKSTTDITEGTNLYFTTARADTAFDNRLATKSTTNLAEGTNLYYTDARFDSRLASKTTDNLTEGSNLYFTTARARDSFSAGTGISISNGVITNTVTDTNTTYSISAETVSGGANLRLTGSDSSTDNVKIAGSGSILVSRTDADTITIANMAPSPVFYDVSLTNTVPLTEWQINLNGSDASQDTIRIGASGGAVLLSGPDADKFTINASLQNETAPTLGGTLSIGSNAIRNNTFGANGITMDFGDSVTISHKANTGALIINGGFGPANITNSSGSIGLNLYTTNTNGPILIQPNGTGNTVIKNPVITEKVTTVSYSFFPNFDPANGSIQKIVLTGDMIFSGIKMGSGALAGESLTIIVQQDATGGRELLTGVLFANGEKTLSTAPNAIDIIYVFSDGSNQYATLQKGFA